MKIKSLQLKNFKRFTDLTLRGIPDNANLVLLIGANGTGKSSVLDALSCLSGQNSNLALGKNSNSFELIVETEYGKEGLINGSGSSDAKRPAPLMERDERIDNEVERMYGSLLKQYFVDGVGSKTAEAVIDLVNASLKRIFGTANGTTLRLKEIVPPRNGIAAEINFEKGNSTFPYNNLSAGEKEVFNTLIKLIAKKEQYRDTVFYYDEIDLHLNVKLQYNFLKEITEHCLPENCQCWTASHSTGFIAYATGHDGGCVLDLDDFDFDKPQVITPKPKDGFQVFEIAVSNAFIDMTVQGRKIVFSENTTTSFYNDLNIAKTLFFVALDKNDVWHKARKFKQLGIIEREYLSDEEVLQCKKEYPFLRILPYYSFENILYHPDNLAEYYATAGKPFDRSGYVGKMTEIKNREKDCISGWVIWARNGYPFYQEAENAGRLQSFKDNHRAITDLFQSDEFETFYKVFPAKDYGRDLEERRDTSQAELSKTQWFKQTIESIVI